MSSRSIGGTVTLLLLCPGPALADPEALTFLGPARAISHSLSASRDTALPGMVVAPHRVLTGGADLGFLGLRTGGFGLKLGLFAMLELESEGTTSQFLPFPQADIAFWRGLYGFSISASTSRWGRGLLGPDGALEATLSVRHESEHFTGGQLEEGPRGCCTPPDGVYADVPNIGNFVMPDVAARLRRGPLQLEFRAQAKVFVLTYAYGFGPGGDLVVRWRGNDRIQPFLSSFAELLLARHGYQDVFLIRSLLGVALPSPAGDLLIFFTADTGHRKGLRVMTQERTLGLGLRAAFF